MANEREATSAIESELLFISEPAHTYKPDRSVVLLSDAISAVRAASAGKQELLEALQSFMALDRSFSTICDEHLNEMKGPMAHAVRLARAAIAKAGEQS